MALTAKQKNDLNQSMEAARAVQLGTIIGALVDTGTIVSGSVTPTAASFPVTTGLTSVAKVFCSLSGSPSMDGAMWVSATSGSTAGDIIIKSWKATSTSNPTPVASTGFTPVYWMAIGS